MRKKLEWSFSALSTLRKCNRMYYFQYLVASHYFKNSLRRKVYQLKKSKNLLMWRGSVIDKIIELEIIPKIKQKQRIDYNIIAEKAVELAKKQFNFSEKKLYTDKKNSESKIGAEYCVLDIHESNIPYKEEDIIHVYSSIKEIITEIPEIEMPDGKMMLTDYLAKASFIVPNLRGWSFEFENLRISPQIDLFMFVENKAVVLDWKVSKSEVSDYSRQLIIAGITVFDVYRRKSISGNGKRLSFDDLRLFEVNLLKKSAKEHIFNKQTADECIDYIYLNGEDVEMITEGRKFEEIDINDFPITDKESTCIFCKYRPICSYLITNNNNYDEITYNKSLPNKQFA